MCFLATFVCLTSDLSDTALCANYNSCLPLSVDYGLVSSSFVLFISSFFESITN